MGKFLAAQAVSLAASAIMIVLILASSLSMLGGPEDYGVEWRAPASLTLDSVEVDPEGEALVLTIHLWDSGRRATEWDGVLGVQLADEDNLMLMDLMMRVQAGDFITTKRGSVVDTSYVLTVPFEVLDHLTEGIVHTPDSSLAVRITFTYGSQTLMDEDRWWQVPTYVKVEHVYVDEEEGWLELDVYLFDASGRTTKWSGDLRVIINDSTGFEMFNATTPVTASEFNHISLGWAQWFWLKHWVPFEDIRPSMDRIETGSDDGNGSGRTMRTIAWFEFPGGVARQDADAFTAIRETQRIPDALLVENEAPVPVLETDRLGLAGRLHHFDASGTTDDMGREGLTYEWDWGDGTLTEVTDVPYADHTFTRAGSFAVKLRVVDREGAYATAEVSIAMLKGPGLLGDWNGSR